MYTPPAGNAVTINFSAPGYTPPVGTAIVFDFGGTPPPPTATASFGTFMLIG